MVFKKKTVFCLLFTLQTICCKGISGSNNGRQTKPHKEQKDNGRGRDSQQNDNNTIHCKKETNCATDPNSQEQRTATTQPETSTRQHSPDTIEDMGSGTAAGICVAVVLIIAAIIATLVYFRKRYINSRRFNKMSESRESRPDHESQPNSPVGTTPTEQSVRNNVDGAEYNYLHFSIQNAENTSHYVEISETGNSVVDSNIKLNPYSYESAYKVRSNTSGEDIPYNKLCARNKVNPKTQGLGGSKIDNYDKLGGNSYDVLGTRPTFETGKTYATTSEQESATNTYDTCLPSSEKLKQSQGGFTDNIYAVNSDTYNILGNETKQSKTDQLYGMKQVEKFKDILKLGGNENIYNTTSGKSETNTVTDNPYAKLGH